jgi:hypothetical protein
MMERKFAEREKVIFLAILNTEVEKTLADWKESRGFLGDIVKLQTLTHLAREAGGDFVLEISQDAIHGGEVPCITKEAKKYFKQKDNGTLIFTLPVQEELKISRDYLRIMSSDRLEGRFDRAYVLSIVAK